MPRFDINTLDDLLDDDDVTPELLDQIDRPVLRRLARRMTRHDVKPPVTPPDVDEQAEAAA